MVEEYVVWKLQICGITILFFSIFNFLGWAETESSLVRWPVFDLLYQALMIDVNECEAVVGMRIGKGN
jgi:hypothetical protein